jgi:TonB family protein
MKRFETTKALVVLFLVSTAIGGGGCGGVRMLPAEGQGRQSRDAGRTPDPATASGPMMTGTGPQALPAPGNAAPVAVAPSAPLFRMTECRGGCVDITVDAIEDFAFTRRYVEAIGRRIALYVVYPWETVERGAEGTVELHGMVDRKGKLVSKEVFRSSGKPLLDNAAMDSLVAAAPFNPFPSAPYVQSLRFQATFRYLQ